MAAKKKQNVVLKSTGRSYYAIIVDEGNNTANWRSPPHLDKAVVKKLANAMAKALETKVIDQA